MRQHALNACHGTCLDTDMAGSHSRCQAAEARRAPSPVGASGTLRDTFAACHPSPKIHSDGPGCFGSRLPLIDPLFRLMSLVEDQNRSSVLTIPD